MGTDVPADGADAGGIDDAVGGFFGEEVHAGFHVDEGDVIFEGGFESGGFFGIKGGVSVVEVGCDGIKAVLGEVLGERLEVFIDTPHFLDDEEGGGGGGFGEGVGVGEVEAGFGLAVGGGAGEPAEFDGEGPMGVGGGGSGRGGGSRGRRRGVVAVHGVVEFLIMLIDGISEASLDVLLEVGLGEEGVVMRRRREHLRRRIMGILREGEWL